jgi:hypothetical protein
MSDWGTTTRVPAVVTLRSGDALPGHLHVLDGLHGGRPETPLEMLNRPDGFFPLTLDDGTAFFVSKAQVATVMVEWPPEGAAAQDAIGQRVSLRVALSTGEETDGEVLIVAPPGHSRALDYLNQMEPFFQLETARGPRLVNRDFVQVVRPLD